MNPTKLMLLKRKSYNSYTKLGGMIALLTFKELYLYIISTLEDLENDTNAETYIYI